ncbi:MAG: ferredoxin [Cyanobacteria bacterium P01_F01_bin.42]
MGRSGFEPELGSQFRDDPERSGLEPELGGEVRQRGVYVDEPTCIGCKNCALIASNTFYVEEEHGRARAFRQNGDPEDVIQEAIDTCPVDCIHWLDFTELKQRELGRQNEVLSLPGDPIRVRIRKKDK